MENGILILTPAGGQQAKFLGASLNTPPSGKGIPNPNPGKQIGNFVGPLPLQVAGLVPLGLCNTGDCRDTQQLFCDPLPVFGDGGSVPSYSNDFNTFLVDTVNMLGTAQFVIQKNTNGWFANIGAYNWATVATLNNNSYGINYALGTIAYHPTYTGYAVNWGAVVQAFGVGLYRIVVNVCTNSYATQASNTFAAPLWNRNTAPIQVFLSAKAPNGTIYTLPGFTVSTNSTTASQIAYIVAQINAATGPSFPFTAIATLTGWTVSGINGSSQNNYLFYWEYKLISTDPDIQDGNGLLTGGSAAVSSCVCGLQSPAFLLKKWNCFIAAGTVKFESWIQGQVGSTTTPGTLFDFCNISWYDSIRFRGFFGYKKFKYDEVMLEYGFDLNAPFGKMERVRDKAVPMYQFHSHNLPQWIHDRLAVYAFMSDTLLVSDYNLGNSDYSIKQKNVVKAGGYEPAYLDNKPFDLQTRYLQRRSYVTVDFAEGIQSIIKNFCCQTV